MTVDEKREAVAYYCSCVDERCVLNHRDWEHTTNNCIGCGVCLKISEATEAELDRALALIAEAPDVKPATGAPEPCVLEQVIEDADTVIKIKSNRKINRLIIEFTEEVQA